jgi:ribonucleoside-diphosphate reductase alpha chain
MALSEAGRVLLESRYLLPGESASGMFHRVAGAVNTGKEDQFFRIMEDLLFLPNSPTLMKCRDPRRAVIGLFCAPCRGFNSRDLYCPEADGPDS